MSSRVSPPVIGLLVRQPFVSRLFDQAEIDVGVEDASLAQLIEHLVATHHDYVRRELPLLRSLLAQTAEQHGARHPELFETTRVLHALGAELTAQLAREEQVLFPAIRRLEQGARRCAAGLDDAVWVIENEHRRAGEALSRLRWLTGGYVTPRDGGPLYRQLVSRLAEFEADLHLHIQKENNLLFPRALRLAERIAEVEQPVELTSEAAPLDA